MSDAVPTHSSGAARRGLVETLEYVESNFGARASADVLERLIGAFETIADRPQIGRVREDITQDRSVRFLSVAPSLIAYRRGPDGGIEVLFVERGERDWAGLLEPRH